jgi:hypothetical protein
LASGGIANHTGDGCMTQEKSKTIIQENQVGFGQGGLSAGGFPHTRETEGPARTPVVSPGGKPACPRCADSDGDSGAFPSLVNNGQSRTFNTGGGSWSRKQKRAYRNILSWILLRIGEKCQLLRVDLTNISGKEDRLTEDFKKLRRIVENTFKYKIQYFKIETYEANGVLHMIWAIQCPSAVWIPQKWLSRTWESITGAHRVWVSRVGARRGKDGRRFKNRSMETHAKAIAGYMAGQYLADQDAIKRVSWSWWRNGLPLVRAWKEFCSLCQRGTYQVGVGLVYNHLKRWELFKGWGEMLSCGWWSHGSRIFYLEGSEVKSQNISILGG